MDNYFLVKYKFDMGAYSLDEMILMVEKKLITEEEFRSITSYHYQGIKESRTE